MKYVIALKSDDSLKLTEGQAYKLISSYFDDDGEEYLVIRNDLNWQIIIKSNKVHKLEHVELQQFAWQPFETAPKDGRTVITEKGDVVWMSRENNLEVREGWYYISDLNDYNGKSCPISYFPSFWIRLPPVPKAS